MDSTATRYLTVGLIAGVILNLPFYALLFDEYWPWAQSFPIVLLSTGLVVIITFFHEIGHTLFAWFYGYPTIPLFDFAHGGGWAWAFAGRQYVLIAILYAAIAYGIYILEDYRWLQILLGLAAVFHLATAYDEDMHQNIIDFMGQGFVPVVACFFLFRAIMDLAPRGGAERFLNAALGFAMLFQTMLDAYGLLHVKHHRLGYYNQKGQHAVGDFDKIAVRLIESFDLVVYGLMGWIGVCVVMMLLLCTIKKP